MRTRIERTLRDHVKSEVSMGKQLTKTFIHRMEKIGLVLAFTVIVSMVLQGGWIGQNTAEAAIAVQQAWTKAIDVSGSSGSASYTVNAGAGRLMVVAVTSVYTSGNNNQAASVTFGGVTLTLQETDGTYAQAHTYLFYLKDAQIPAGAQNISVNTSGGSSYLTVYVAVFSGVDQTAVITDSRSNNSGGGWSSSVSSISLGAAMTVNAGDQAVYLSNIYNDGSNSIPTYTLPANWTSGANDTGTSGSLWNGQAWKSEVCSRIVPGSNTTDSANISSINPQSLASISGMSIKAAPVCVRNNPTVTINAPTSQSIAQGGIANYIVSVTNNDTYSCTPTTFTLSTTNTPAVPNANFDAATLSTTALGPISGGATMTAVLTHTADPSAFAGQTEQSSVTTAADAYHSAVTAPAPAVSTVVSTNGKIVYSNGTNTAQYRDYSRSLNIFGAETPAVPGAGQTFIVDRACPVSNEHIAGYVTTAGQLYIMRWDGTQWNNEWNATVGGDGVTGRRFDIAYGYNSGVARVVYANNNVTGQFIYMSWNGTSWSAPATITMSRLTGYIVSLRLAAASTSGTLTFALAALDSNGRLSAMIYDTSIPGWSYEPSSALSTNVYRNTSPGDVPAFGLAFENTSGDLLVVNTSNSDGNIHYSTSANGTWSSLNTLNTGQFNAGAIFAAADPNAGSNNILVAATRGVGNNGVMSAIWNGSSFSTVNNSTSLGSNLSAYRMPLNGGFVSSGGTTAAVIVYNDGQANRLGYSYTTNGGTSWTATNTTAVTIGNGTKAWINVAVDPTTTNVLMATLSDDAADLWAKRLVYTAPSTFAWTNVDGGTALTTGLASINSQNFSFAYTNPKTVLGDGVTVPNATVCPATANQKIGAFSFNTTMGSDIVTGLTVTTTNQAAIASMQIWDEAGTTQYFTTVNNTGSDTWTFSGGTSIPVTSTAANYMIQVTYRNQASAPVGNLDTTAVVIGYTCTNAKMGTNDLLTTTTLDNAPAVAATWGTNNTASGTATLNWTLGTPGDNVMIARFPNNTDSTAVVEGAIYTVGQAFGSGVVAYVGGSTSFTDSVPLGGTYYYRIFEYDGCANYSTTAPWSSAIVIPSANPTAAGTATAVAVGPTSIVVIMPYTGDVNANNFYSVDYKLSSSGTWLHWVVSAAHTPSPYSTVITGLTPGSNYDVQCYYFDPDGVTGTTPQLISQVHLPMNGTTAGTATASVLSSTSLLVTMPYTDDYNGNNSYTVDFKLSASGTWTNVVTNATHTGSPYQVTINGLSANTSYDVRTTWSDPDGVGGANPQIVSGIQMPQPWANVSLLHNSINTSSTKWSGVGGWGIAGAKYGAFDCITCHDPNTTNVSRIQTGITVPDTSKGNIPGGSGSPVTFLSKISTTVGFGNDQETRSASTRICEVCHTQNAFHDYSQAAPAPHELSQHDCTACHQHKNGFRAPGCTDCHAVQQGNRVAVIGLFAANSHHIQGVAVTNKQCYQCHWEANSDGSVNPAYHGGWVTPGSAVNLVIYGAGVRPTTYTVGVTAVQYNSGGSSATPRTELTKINQHCLGCHSAQNKTTMPFGDGNTPNTYAWDGTCSNAAYNGNQTGCTTNGGSWTPGTSVDERYSQAGTTNWGKYSGANVTPKNTQIKAFSAHGNAAVNQRGWNLTETWPNTSGSVNVMCFDCHNSHGSNVNGTTTTYVSDASGTRNGAMLKSTTANLGGYTMTYQPQPGGSVANKNPYNPGAALCFDCHMTQTAGTTPWGWQSTFGGTQAVLGYWEKPFWYGAAGQNPAGPQMRYPYKNAIGSTGGHFGASSPLTTPVMGTIGGLCTPCHDPHGVSPTLGSNQQYGVPLLKGTWLTSPYKEDVAPVNSNEPRGGGREARVMNVGSTPLYHLDQNTFDVATPTRNGGFTWNFTSTKRVTQTPDQFAGLCLRCHPKSSIAPTTGTQSNPAAWKSVDRIHNSVATWGTYGANAGNAVHSYTCSKCHSPHNACLNRLLITNCLNWQHRTQVASGGVTPVKNTERGRRGEGAGNFPGGGGGQGDEPRYPGPYFFGSARSPYTRACHDNANTTGDTYPNIERWNSKSPW